MASPAVSIAHTIGLLADHLDAILAAGEDLLALSVDIEGARRSDGAAAPWERFEPFVGKLKLYELTIVSRVLIARQRASDVLREVQKTDPMIGRLVGSFIGGTAILEDAITELADRTGNDFDCGLDPLAYMRTRGIIPADAGTLLAGTRTIEAGEEFLIARRIAIGALMDMVSAFLDALDNAYNLFPEQPVETDDLGDDVPALTAAALAAAMAVASVSEGTEGTAQAADDRDDAETSSDPIDALALEIEEALDAETPSEALAADGVVVTAVPGADAGKSHQSSSSIE